MPVEDAITTKVDQLESATRRVVIFDTNVYRQVAHVGDVDAVRETFARLRAEESEHGVQALAHALVVLELLARLADPGAKDYANVKAAVAGLFEHCHMLENGERHLAIVPDPDLQLCMSLFQETPDSMVESVNVLQFMVKQIAEDPSEVRLDQMRPGLQRLADIVSTRERDFARDIKEQIGEDPDSPNWRPLKDDPEERTRLIAYLEGPEAEMQVARSFVLRTLALLGRTANSDEIDSKAAFLAGHLRIPIRIYNQWVLKAVRDNADPANPKRANTLWDLHICFSIGADNTINNRPTWLVTGEKQLRAAAEAVVSDTLVLPYRDYRERLRTL